MRLLDSSSTVRQAQPRCLESTEPAALAQVRALWPCKTVSN